MDKEFTTGRPGGTALASPRLVLIEDDAGVRRSMQLLLYGQGFEVHSFASAGPALADAASPAAQYLVIDFALPDDDGIRVLKRLRANGWNGVAVLITAFYSKELCEAACSAGFAGVIAKPFRDSELLDVLARARIAAE